MTAEQLRAILKNVPGNLMVEISTPGDEIHATCVTKDRRYLRICQDDSEISIAETVLHRDGEN